MNCLYGKFGQQLFGKTFICNTKEFISLIRKHGNNITNVKHIPGDKKRNSIIIVSTKQPSKNKLAIGKLIHIANYITSSARKNLFDIVYEAGIKNTYYVDTDSCFYTGKRIKNIHPSKLGYCDSEIDENIESNNVIITKFVANAPKFYGVQGYKKVIKDENNKYKDIKNFDDPRALWIKMGDKIKSKGVKKGNINFKDCYRLNNNEINNIKICGINFNKNIISGNVVVSKIDKIIRNVYSKRKFEGNESKCF
jgi:hypothetical protein